MTTMFVLVVLYFGLLLLIGVIPEDAMKILLVVAWAALAMMLVGSLVYQTFHYIVG